MLLLGFSSGNALAFGRYVLFAAGKEEGDGWKPRGIAVGCITFCVLVHSIIPKWGIRLFNVLGVFKVFVLLFICFSGFAALAGHRKVPNPHNFDNAFRLEEGPGYGGGGAYAYATAILRIVYSFKGERALRCLPAAALNTNVPFPFLFLSSQLDTARLF
jgi:amino acid transporter